MWNFGTWLRRARSSGVGVVAAALGVATCGLVDLAPAAADHPGVVTVTVTRVVNIGDEGIEDNLRGEADMYAAVEIAGTPFDSKAIHVDDDDNVEPVAPAWVFTRPFSGGDPDAVGVSIEIWEHDDCDPPKCSFSPDPFGGSDDQGDVDPDAGDDRVDLVVDRSDGTWTGDTTSPDACSQGDDLSDGDRRVLVCWDISVTSASGDADGDGLLDGWESRGFDADGDGTIDVDLPGFGANPLHKDLFLELDWETGQSPGRADIQAMKSAFRAAPLTNPDGANGVNLWVDTGPLVDGGAREGQAAGTCSDGLDNGGDGFVDGNDGNCRFLDGSVEDPAATNCNDGLNNDGDALVDGNDPDCLVGDNLGGGGMVTVTGSCNLDGPFYAAKANNFNGAARRWIFRYSVSLNLEPACPSSGGWGERGGNDFMDFNHDGGTIMHELGHNLDLQHGGNEGNNCKPNYVSVMNYDNQFRIRRAGGGSILDYSPARDTLNGSDRGVAPLANLVENDLDDGVVLDGTDGSNRYVFTDTNGAKVVFPLNQGANWNSDTDPPGEANQSVNIDTNATGGGPAACNNGSNNDTLEGFDDWTKVSLPFRQFGDSEDGAIDPETTPNPTIDELEDLEADLNTTDLAVSVADSPDPVAAGTQLTYTVTATNNGPNPATSVQVVDTLPADVDFVSASPGCTAAGQVVTCNIGELLAHTSEDVTIVVGVPADLVYVNGGPKTITNDVTVANVAGPDSNGANNADSETTEVIAVADVRVDSVTTTSPLEVIIGQPAPASVDVVVANGGPSSPVDAVLTGAAGASAGSTVTPTATQAPVTALSVGTPQTVTQGFSLGCTTPGVKTVTFDYTIALANAEDVDPDLTDNTRQASFQIDCVVPIAINIRPHGFPNSINLNTDATLAALTTAAGEYGLPLAFDASTIDIATVRFGLRTNLFNTGTPTGAKEIHNRNHLERSWELDETTRDADRDGLMHFKPADSGLTVTSTEGCLKGRFVVNGQSFTFFGCDSVNVVN